jgi:hypothetical protein
MARKRTVIWIVIGASVAAAAVLLVFGVLHWRPHWTVIQGAVVRSDSDPRKQLPIAGVTITASHGDDSLSTESDASGYFSITFPGTVLPGQMVTLQLRHPDYEPLDLNVTFRLRSSLRQLVIADMTPSTVPVSIDPGHAQSVVSNIRVRYTVNSQSDENVGSVVRTFPVVSRRNIPCDRQSPCSPDGLWKATMGTLNLDAGPGNVFRDARASCIAGPCPFTRISWNGDADGSRTIAARALDWSDTATFLVEAEVFRAAIGSNVRESYPFIFGTALNFTIPASAEGVSLEAEINGQPMIFPLGPELYLSWATCSGRSNSEAGKSMVYQCELKPEFRF